MTVEGFHAKACAHAVCGDECDFVPPAIGPKLPTQVVDAEGERWTRSAHYDSTVFYWQRGKDVRIAFWREIQGKRSTLTMFPAGPWLATLDGDWYPLDVAEHVA